MFTTCTFGSCLTGCDTTSRIFGISKPVALKALLKDNNISLFVNHILKYKEVGEELIIHLFRGVTLEDLDLLRFRKFATKVMASSYCVHVHTLPSTSAAAVYNSQRVHLQVHTWIGNSSYPRRLGMGTDKR